MANKTKTLKSFQTRKKKKKKLVANLNKKAKQDYFENLYVKNDSKSFCKT